MKSLNINIILCSILLVTSFIVNIALDIYIVPRRFVRTDQEQHYYDMKRWYESKKFPVTSARFTNSHTIDNEFETGRVPGGAYYVFYILFYKLASESLLGAKIINLIFSLLILFVFLFWFYKKYGLTITSFLGALLLINPYFIMSSTDFWNPNSALIFSFLLFIFLYEYINSKNENIVKFSAVIIFPIVAIIAQFHFFTFFSIVPTIIVYLIIRFKRTKKYFIFWVIGVFLSFLEYVPYLVNELQNDFFNMKMIFSTKSGFSSFPFPQIHSIILLTTNEMSIYHSSNMEGIVNFWKSIPYSPFIITFLFLTILFSAFCFIRSIYIFFSKKYYKNSPNENTLIEMIFIILIYIPVTIFFNIVFVSKVGAFHYFFPFFIMFYVPIILFLVQKIKLLESKNKIRLIFFIIFMLNILANVLQLSFYIKNYEEPMNIANMKNIIKCIYDDSKGIDVNLISIYGERTSTYCDISKIYFPEYTLNCNNGTNLYVLIDFIKLKNSDDPAYPKYINYLATNSKTIYTNKYILVYKFNHDTNELLNLEHFK